MAKAELHQPRGKHVLLVVKKKMGHRWKLDKDALGIPQNSFKHITNGDNPLSAKAAAKVAEALGVSFGYLMAGDASKPPITESGELFTEETYQRHRAQREQPNPALPVARKRGDEAFRLFYQLCVKLGRVLLAAHEGTPAQPEGDTRFAAWAARDALIKIGNLYPSFDTNRSVRSGVITLRSIPETFDHELQALMNSGKKRPDAVWRSIQKRLHRDLLIIEKKQARAAS